MLWQSYDESNGGLCIAFTHALFQVYSSKENSDIRYKSHRNIMLALSSFI